MAQNSYTSEDALAIRRTLESGDLHRAIQVHRMLFPPHPMPYMHELDESDLRDYLETPLPIFSFCSNEELRELRLRMAMAVCLGIEKAIVPDAQFPWSHPMSAKAVAQNFFKATAIHRNVSTWMKSGLVERVKILNSFDGPCQACLEAAHEYTLSDLPQIPLHNCENINTIGCRCGVVATKITGLSRTWRTGAPLYP
jgi:hypothetical protein